MTILLFEDEYWQRFAAIALARPLFELRCGVFSLRERVEALVAARQLQTNTYGLCRPHLMGVYGPPEGLRSVLQTSEPITLINGRALDLAWLPDLLNAPLETAYLAGDTLLGARISKALASAVLYYLREQRASIALEELHRFARVVEIGHPEPPLLLQYPWDLINYTGEQIARDVPLLAERIPLRGALDPTVTIRGEAIYVHPTARLEGPVVLDARAGPLIIDADAHIEPFSFIQGPAYIGQRTLIASARIRGETSFGPVCRIGGEVEASIVQGYSNKHHDGFLGHSWLGEWVNIGAMTTNSDLKNNYGTVRLPVEGLGQIDSGMIKLGCFLADHVKLGIGLHLNGGTMIGTGSNVFGVHTAPKLVPPFTWGGDVFREYRIESMIDVARKVMSRRKRELDSAQELLLRELFALTRASRGELVVPPSRLRSQPGRAELALARAEAEAIAA
jgi:UDP-N-acetylglucosamine diphosphorylase / glucose-1-phosphate thymidylyltransferase / UDP-N-acetylgalactosamine diphosphorylase / glucosamine-1-phosphate N-acetyltransferase / galactosamine-1-phosphate N-acetyltransferase